MLPVTSMQKTMSTAYLKPPGELGAELTVEGDPLAGRDRLAGRAERRAEGGHPVDQVLMEDQPEREDVRGLGQHGRRDPVVVHRVSEPLRRTVCRVPDDLV